MSEKIKKEKNEGLLDELKEELFKEPQIKELHPILDHYNAEINRKLGKELFKL